MPPKRSRPKKPARKSGPTGSRPPKQPGKRGSRSDWRLPLLLLASALVILGLVWLARRAEHLPPAPPSAPAVTQVAPAAAAREQIEAFLAVTGVPDREISRSPADHPRHYQVRYRSPSAAAVEQLRQNLRQLEPPLGLFIPEDGVLKVVDGQGATLLTMQYLPPPPAPKAVAPTPVKGGKVAIIVDDLGRGTRQARQLLAIRQPVTFAILPSEAHAAEVARMAHAAGREVMLHVPMEPQGFPVIDPGDDALLVNLPKDQLRAQLQVLLNQVPHVAGVNNHMGSRFTEDQQAMAVVMAVLREEGLYFVDSLTSSQSVGTATARQAGVPSLRRDVFLDNVAEVAAIAHEIRRLAAKATRNGSAVGICHPYPETITALRQELPELARQGVEFVAVSALLKTGGGGR